jgi:DNA-binding FrmR family transcriptional regulator
MTKITAIEGLAEFIHETMASKEDIKAVRAQIAEVNGRLDRIEKHILADYGRRIERLEQDLKRLKDTLAV